jgi:hypothetical protein
MEVLTQVLGTDAWTRWPTVLRGLLGALGRPARCVVLLSTAPQEEREQLAEATLLLRRMAGRDLPVIVAGPEGPGTWRDDVRIAGITRIWTIRRVVPVAPGRVRLDINLMPDARVLTPF